MQKEQKAPVTLACCAKWGSCNDTGSGTMDVLVASKVVASPRVGHADQSGEINLL